MRRHVLPVGILLLIASMALAQDAGLYVDRIRAGVRGPEVRITWRDPDADLTELLIYRSGQAFTEPPSGSDGLVGRVEPGVEEYIDVLAQPGEYFYAVLVRDTAGELQDRLFEFRNVLSTPVAVSEGADLELLAAQVSGLQSRVDQETITLQFTSDRLERRLAVYRFAGTADPAAAISGASPLATVPGTTGAFTDRSAIPGVPYRYVVIDAELVERGQFNLEAGTNLTVESVTLPIGEQPGRRIGGSAPAADRTRPLPLLTRGAFGLDPAGSDLPAPQDAGPVLAPDVESAIVRLLGTAPAGRKSLQPVILPLDERAPETAGFDRALYTVLQTEFQARNWDGAVTQLENLLLQPLDAALQARVYYYLGQALYFRGDRNDSVVSFILARDQLFRETAPWLDAILRELAED